MIEIYMDNGLVYTDVDIRYEKMIEIMQSPMVKNDAVISFRFRDEKASRGCVIKGHVAGFSEV